MALKMICSHWLVCGWILWLLFGMVVAIFQRYAYPSRFAPLKRACPDLIGTKWEGRWTCYGKLHGQLEEERMRVGRSDRSVPGVSWRGKDGSGWSYA